MNKKDLNYLAELSYIQLSENESEEFNEQLIELFKHIENALSGFNVLKITDNRENEQCIELTHNDCCDKSYNKESMLVNVKNERNGFILVPKIIREDN